MKTALEAFRYLTSFTTEQVVSCYAGTINPEIEVSLVNGRYQINAGDVNYSYGPLHDAFRRYFNLDPPLPGADKPVLILGFGGGSVATILRNERRMPNPITGVELDELMIRAGKEHFGIGKLGGLNLIHGDALQFVEQCRERFSLIVVDIYINAHVPEVFEQQFFFEQVKQCLLPGGKLVFNKLLPEDTDPADLNRLEKLFSGLFEHQKTYRIAVNKKVPNYMITAVEGF